MPDPSLRRSLGALLLAATAASASAQTLAVTASFDGAPGPFVPGQLVDVALSGLEPFRPFTLFAGDAGPPLIVPGVNGVLEILPATIFGLGPFDGLHIFGGGLPVTSNSLGEARFTIPLPAPPIPLPRTISVQAIVLTNPFNSPGGFLFRFTNRVAVTIDEPATSPVISGFDLHTLAEGAPAPLLIFGTGFLPQSTVVPVVSFRSQCDPTRSGVATGVTLIDVDPGPALVPALRVMPPPDLGGPTAPPQTGSGPVTVIVDYGPTGLYPNNPSLGRTQTLSVAFGDPTFLSYQSPIVPAIAMVDPSAQLGSTSCPITITGSGFLRCAEVVFNPGLASEVHASGVTVLSDTVITCTSPPFARGVFPVAVRNPDHVPPSPRQSALAPPATDFRVFNIPPGSIAVTAMNPGAVVEGTGGVLVDADVANPTSGPYNALDPAHGLPSLRLGSDQGGTKTAAVLPAISVQVLGPGLSRIRFQAPDLPPGLHPPGVTANGLGNAGVKHLQIVLPACLNPGGLPHRALAAIPAAEPNNRFTYLAPFAPAVAAILPNNCVRVDGGQDLLVQGSGFFTNAVSLPSSSPLGPRVEFLQGGVPVASLVAEIQSEGQLRVMAPDFSALAFALPATLDLRVVAPDGQASTTAGASDDLHLYPSLAPLAANPFPTGGPLVVLDTGPFGAPATFSFAGDVTLPGSLLVQAHGEGPLIIRARGDVVIDAAFDLSGGSVTGAPYFHPAGGARGGIAADPMNLFVQDPFQGAFGGSPIDSTTAGFLGTFGLGGFHGVPDAGGGGGGGFGARGAPGQPGSALGGPGGAAFAALLLPIPVLGSGGLAEFYDPPGGAGGGAGGMGTPPPFNPTTIPNPPDPVGFPGDGGNGGGSVVVAADGVITLRGAIVVDGAPGGAGHLAVMPPNGGGGGGGGSGGAILLQAIRGIRVESTAVLRSLGGNGGPGAFPGLNDGGDGGIGRIRLAIPALSATPSTVLVIDPGASLMPAPETVGY